MFITPKTVAQAIAPFEKIKTNLKIVLDAQRARKASAESRIKTARATVKQVENTENATIKSAVEEELRAAALIANLEKLFSADAPVNVDAMSPSKKADAGHKLES